MKVYMRKLAGGVLVPECEDEVPKLLQLKNGEVVSIEWKKANNYKFHKKLFAVLKLAFDAWEAPALMHKGEQVAKNIDQFREDITILSGFYETAVRLDGSIRFSAKSWSFEKMDDEEKERLYNAIINTVLSRVLTNYSRDDLDAVVENLLRFT